MKIVPGDGIECSKRFIKERLEPVIMELLAGRDDAPPPAREYFYELHDLITA